MHKELIIYCDESSSRGAHFSDFYGGAIVGSDNIDAVRSILAKKKADLNLHGEVKWTKITENYQEKYIELVDTFFDLVESGYVKIRIMFTQNMFAATGLTKEHVDNKYFILYYQFIKNAFGLKFATDEKNSVNVRIYLDKMPDKKEKVDEFRQYLTILPTTAEYRESGIKILAENITEVSSHEHDILQCLDIVLGAINFRLNDRHLEKPPGKKRRGKRTVAKEKVYKHINKRINRIYKNFNIGISTGVAGDYTNRWKHNYRHWCFRSTNAEIVGVGKKKK